MWAAEQDSKDLRVARACLDELTAEPASLAVGTEQAKANRDNLAANIFECQFAAATGDGESALWCGPDGSWG